jgi:hypothetical protein
MTKVLYLMTPDEAKFFAVKPVNGRVSIGKNKHYVDSRRTIKALLRNVTKKREPRLDTAVPFCTIKNKLGIGRPIDLYIMDWRHIQPAQKITTGQTTKVTFEAENYNMTPEMMSTLEQMKVLSDLAKKSPINMPNSTILGVIIGAVVGVVIMVIAQSMGWL